MIAGHFGFAAAVKARAPSVPLWSLMLACVWLDVVFVPALVAGAERMVPLPGTHGGYGQNVIYADYTHSIVGALVLSALFGLACAWRWGRRTGVILGAVVLSHWLLDLPMHHADMPVLPGDAGHLPRLGFGLWRWPAVSAALELAIVLVGTYLYWRAAQHAAGTSGARRANVLGAAMLASGLLVLAMSVAGQ